MTAVQHPVFARFYTHLATAMERVGADDLRRELLDGAAGRVLEVGAGAGTNFAHLPPSVDEVVAVEPEPYLRAQASRAAEGVAVPVTVVDGAADRLPAQDASVDTVVCSLVLCTVPDPAAALAEVHRVLRPGGRLLLWEHVRADGGPLARVQEALDRTVWPTIGGGCHTARDTVATVEAAGFPVERLRRFRWPQTRVPAPTSPMVLGTAVRR
ncbi:class I SAM-dependent methyltransferase [Geodermatophilus sp. CPCC 206100]|uniref:class I SAM-dependent methyltransferase n=1 Tax=Geodermatophilus sp. CPCC 206100 TaxID=3020054 RepID=UPI003B00C7C2